MDLDFFKIWFIVSSFVMMHLYLKNRDYRDKADVVVQQINDVWDKDYKDIIQTYGTVENFVDCHYQDFEIFRNNIILFYSMVSDSNRIYMTNTDKLLDLIERGKLNKEEIYKSIKNIKRDTCIRDDDILTQLNNFITNEVEAHSDKDKVVDILNKIDEKYKNKDILKEINKQ